jgi:regulator of RNase E activity RraA
MRVFSWSELDTWRAVPTAVLSDELQHQGVLSGIRPLFPERPFAAQAFTIKVDVGAGEPPRVALEQVRPGTCIVIDARATPESAVWGGNLIRIARECGVSAVVVDGQVRDTLDLRESGLAVCSRGVTPRGPAWRGLIGQSIHCGGIQIAPGDLIVGDDDGVVAVPNADATAELLARCLARIEREAEGGDA